MGKFLDLTGQKFGRLTVIESTEQQINNSVVWKCKCDCGNIRFISSKNLRMGKTNSCGCLKKESDKKPKGNVINEIGNKYGHLTVIARDGSDNKGHAKWLCECDCENHTIISTTGDNLRRGHTLSCGCERRSHGEIKIATLLLENGIPFETEKAFSIIKTDITHHLIFM